MKNLEVLHKLKRLCIKRTPEILAGSGIGCWILTTVFAVKATPGAVKKIEEKKEELSTDELGLLDTVKAVGKDYILPATTAMLGTGCMAASVAVSNKRYSALSTMYTAAIETANIYRSKVIETIGEKKEEIINQKAIAEEAKNKNPLTEKTYVQPTDDGDYLCQDAWSGRYFRSSKERILMHLAKFNSDLENCSTGYKSLNEWYSLIGLSPIDCGDEYGWILQYKDPLRLLEVYDSSQDGTPCLILKFSQNPKSEYYLYSK